MAERDEKRWSELDLGGWVRVDNTEERRWGAGTWA